MAAEGEVPYFKPNSKIAELAKSNLFEQVTLLVIGVNAIWIAVDVDGNNAASLVSAKPEYVIMDNFFCIFFSFEICIRFLAVTQKCCLLKDTWFIFDSALVSLMIVETWVVTIVVAATGDQGESPLGSLSVLRLLRLLRLARLGRLMRAMPELMVMLRGMASALRSVLVTCILLLAIVYVFSVALVQILDEDENGNRSALSQEKFRTVPVAMYTLIVDGILPDYAPLLRQTETVGWFPAAITMVFVIVATLTVMNMLVGILCEVACRVSQISREQMDYQYVSAKLQTLVSTNIDTNGDNEISKDEFLGIIDNEEAVRALKGLGVDVNSMREQADMIYGETFIDEDGNVNERKLSFSEFMEVVNSMRPMNSVTVKDIVALRKYVHNRVTTVEERLGVSTISGRASQVFALSSPNSSPRLPEPSQGDSKGYTNGHNSLSQKDNFVQMDECAPMTEVDMLRQQVQSLQRLAERLVDSQAQMSGNVQALNLQMSSTLQGLGKGAAAWNPLAGNAQAKQLPANAEKQKCSAFQYSHGVRPATPPPVHPGDGTDPVACQFWPLEEGRRREVAARGDRENNAGEQRDSSTGSRRLDD
eukprot:TRINITY_DN43159_c0_g1_i1.p1 TRINITY_DN43159_c0_g1~~TRINITY_DN43159_c0_g1_i1.p1  ORF type:complete len:590 (-),score=110.25 TRINITY_DN43159_c0_g1_i1:11-1780(-)